MNQIDTPSASKQNNSKFSMNRFRSGTFKFALALLFLALLYGCAGAPPAPTPVEQPVLSAEQQFSDGNYVQAARLWQQLAESADLEQASALRARAADAWLLADRPAQAQLNLDQVEPGLLSQPDLARLNLVQADLAIRADKPNEALAWLELATPDLPPESADRFTQLMQQTRLMLSQPGVRDISQALAIVSDSTDYQPDQALQFLSSMEDIPSQELALRSVNPRGNQNFSGWISLALVIRQNLVSPRNAQKNLAAWKLRYPYHSLSEEQALDLWSRYRQEFTAPQKIAVLLPGPGRLQRAAEAIRDGIISAYLDNPGDSELMFLSTGEGGELANAAYQEAVARGAERIIGPLEKLSIEQVLNESGLATPVLALNDLPPDYRAPPGLQGQIQAISLSQDDEARAIAREAAQSGFSSAIIIAPESEWGERMAQNFQVEFLQENRQIVASARYLESENDHSPTLERLLKIDESKARKQQVETALQMKLAFEPVRREDVDVIFLAADSAQGRSLRPQLKFHYAGDIPVYAPARVFAGKVNRTRDQDLNGVRFPTTPMQLDPAQTKALPDFSSTRSGTFTSLYALGMDAWNILPWLSIMQSDPDFHFPGAAGTYSADSAGTLSRIPAFALFKRGAPIAFESEKPSPNTH